MGSLDDVVRRIAKLEKRRNLNPEARLPERMRTRLRVSRMYTQWLQQGGGSRPDLEPEEEELWELFLLYERLADEHQHQLAMGGPVGEYSDQLTADFADWYEAHGQQSW